MPHSLTLRHRAGGIYRLLGFFMLSLALQTPAFAGEGRHALLIGIGRYAPASNATDLKGVPFDLQNARRMAKVMGVEDAAIVELKDAEATKANIEARLDQLSRKVLQGDRVFIYFSGHGTRRSTPSGCEEGLFTYDGEMINEQEMARFTGPMSQRSEKLVTMMDACFSGGVVTGTRSLAQAQGLVAKFVSKAADEACSIDGVNIVAPRSLLSELGRFGIRSENFVQIAAAKRDEVSWDDPDKGGVATQAISRCLLGEAEDLNRSGAVSLDEVRACAQKLMDETMAPHRARGKLPSTMQVSGNRNLIVAPAVLSKPPAPVVAVQPAIPPPSVTRITPEPAPPLPLAPPPVVVTAPTLAPQPVVSEPQPVKIPPAAPLAVEPLPVVVLQPVAPDPIPPQPVVLQPIAPAPQPVPLPLASPNIQPPPAQAEPVGALATMRDIYQQRDPRRQLIVNVPAKTLRIDRDKLSMTVKSAVAGYVYVVLLGSDEKSFYLLFPNRIDQDNRIKANETLKLPRPAWQVTAGGPAGTDKLLVVVSQSARDAKIFVPDENSGGGAFTFALADLQSRGRLIDFFLGKGVKGRSAAMSAALVDIREIP